MNEQRINDQAAWRAALFAAATLTLLVLANGCADDFDPPSWLVETRVLAIEATPLDVVGDEEITLAARVFVPAGTTIVREQWRVCPLSKGPYAGYECVAEACEITLVPDADGVVRTRPLPLLLSCVTALGEDAAGSAPPGDAPDVPPSFAADGLPKSVEVVYKHEIEDDAGLVRETVLRLPLWLEGEPEAPNTAPVIARVEIGGTVAADGDVMAPVAADDEVAIRVQIDPDSLDPYGDVDGGALVEEPIVTFYATAGRFEREKKAGEDVETAFQAKDLEDVDVESSIWVVVLDLRGGQAVAGPFHVPIRR